MVLEIKHGLLFKDGIQVPFIPTPNKRGNMKPSYGVIHFTADNNPQSTINWFKDSKAKASAHLLIDRLGNIYQFGLFTEILWHAGTSQWKAANIIGMNSHSIGIELTNLGRTVQRPDSVLLKHKNEDKAVYWQSYTDIQMEVLKSVCDVLTKEYKLIEFLGHDDIAPGRKSDPGPAFDWSLLKDVEVLPTFKTNTSLNLRSGPGTNYKVILTLKEGAVVKELSRSNGWSEIEVNNKKGFVSNKYLI